jgi:glycosyltransferase involved in cell wall biosynthesis
VENLRLPPELIRVSALGVLLDCYRGPGPVRERRRVVYTSQSRRGLKRLLELFPRIRAIVPEAELHIYGYEYNREVTPTDSELFDLRGVVWKGRMRKSDLARELRSAAVLAYPSRFRETFCLAAAEAQAAGLPVVTSDLAALAERVTDGVDGFLIGGRPKKAEYGTAFVERVTQLLSDDELWLRFSAAARRHAFDAYNWDTIAAEWETDLAQLVADRQPGIPATEPTLDLLAPELLISAQRESAIRVPAALAAQSLREEWSSYGYNPATVPGLRPASSSRTARPSVLGTSSA